MRKFIFTALFLVCATLGAQEVIPEAAEGPAFKLFQFPQDRIPRVDGEFSDWDIVPDSYAVTMDDMWDDSGKHEGLDKSSIDLKVKAGWVNGLDRLYFFCEIKDDYWEFDEMSLHNDTFELVVDADLSGGPHIARFRTDRSVSERDAFFGFQNLHAQNYHIFTPPTPGKSWCMVWGPQQWLKNFPWSNVSYSYDFEPGGAGVLRMEFWITPFDAAYASGPEDSVVSRLVEGRNIGLCWAYIDYDGREENNGFWNLSSYHKMYGYASMERLFELCPLEKSLVKPHADWTYELVPGTQEVNFTDRSVGEFDSYHWDFGDGSCSEERNPVHTYSGDNYQFTVTLSVDGPDGPSTCCKVWEVCVPAADAEDGCTVDMRADRFPDGTPVDKWFAESRHRLNPAERRRFVITDYGVVRDSTLLQTAAVQKVIDLAAEKGGTVVVPEGTFLVSSLFFKPHTHLLLEKGAVLKGSDEVADFEVAPVHIEGRIQPYVAAIVNAYDADGFSIEGEGVIDGNGLRYWREFWKRRQINRACTNLEALRPRMIYVANSSDVHIEGVTLLNSPFWNCHLYKCTRVRVKDITVRAPGADSPVKSPSSDGIDVDGCSYVHISGCDIICNDDMVAIKGGKGPWADRDTATAVNSFVLVERCKFGPGPTAVTCGSECVGVRNVIVRDCTVDGSSNVLNLKMRPDTPQKYEYIRVENVRGRAKNFVQARPWTQFFDLQGRRDRPRSRAAHITFVGCEVECSSNIRNIVPKPEEYSLFDINFKDCNLYINDGEKLSGN